jgi:hypothetical protein
MPLTGKAGDRDRSADGDSAAAPMLVAFVLAHAPDR